MERRSGIGGIPSPVSVREVAPLGLPVVASGGIRSGLHVGRAVALGATAAGIAGGVLKAASLGYEETLTEVQQLIHEFRVAMFLTGSCSVYEMRKARYVLTGETREWADRRTGTERGPVTPVVEGFHRRKLAWVKQGHPGPVPSNVAWLEALSPRRACLSARSGAKEAHAHAFGCGRGRRDDGTGPCVRTDGAPTAREVSSRGLRRVTPKNPRRFGRAVPLRRRAITQHRLESLETIGHPTSKVEVILMGGTFPSRPRAYRLSVFQGVFDGLNGVSSPDLASAQRTNETASHRCVSLTVETRPDWCDQRILPELLEAGVTRVEIGVECLRDDVLAAVGARTAPRMWSTPREKLETKASRSAITGCWVSPGWIPTGISVTLNASGIIHAIVRNMLKIYPTLVLPVLGYTTSGGRS